MIRLFRLARRFWTSRSKGPEFDAAAFCFVMGLALLALAIVTGWLE